MPFIPTEFPDLWVIEPRIFKDERGYFYESFNLNLFEKETGLRPDFVQDNQSHSVKGVFRGFHFQQPPHDQAKLVRVLSGKVQDVVIDLRPESPTNGKAFSVILSSENHRQLFVPRGFAHGFLTLSDEAVFIYKTDNFYHPESEAGVIFNESSLDIPWELDFESFLVSGKDRKLPALSDVNFG